MSGQHVDVAGGGHQILDRLALQSNCFASRASGRECWISKQREYKNEIKKRNRNCLPFHVKYPVDGGHVRDILCDLAVLQAFALHAVLVEGEHTVRKVDQRLDSKFEHHLGQELLRALQLTL